MLKSSSHAVAVEVGRARVAVRARAERRDQLDEVGHRDAAVAVEIPGATRRPRDGDVVEAQEAAVQEAMDRHVPDWSKSGRCLSMLKSPSG
jgi:hypothetical protein